MKYENMKDKIVTDQYGYKFIGNSIMVTKDDMFCMICGHPTNYLDTISEVYVCSTECRHRFYQQEQGQEEYNETISDHNK